MKVPKKYTNDTGWTLLSFYNLNKELKNKALHFKDISQIVVPTSSRHYGLAAN